MDPKASVQPTTPQRPTTDSDIDIATGVAASAVAARNSWKVKEVWYFSPQKRRSLFSDNI